MGKKMKEERCISGSKPYKHAQQMVDAIRKGFGEYTGCPDEWMGFLTRRKVAVLLASAPVLTAGEIKILSKVPTTKHEAGVILRRNVSLFVSALVFVKTKNKRAILKTEYGCPHCILGLTALNSNCCCGRCAWKNSGLDPGGSMFCIEMTFGGVCLDKAGVVYYSNGERIDHTMYKSNVSNRYRFLRGHMEWALNIMNGDMKAAKKSYRKG